MEIIAAAKLSALSFFIRIKQSRNRPAPAGGRRRRPLAKRLGYSDKRKRQEIRRIGSKPPGVRSFGYCADVEDRNLCASRVILLLQIPGRGIIYQLSVAGEAGTVARAVPGMFLRIPF